MLDSGSKSLIWMGHNCIFDAVRRCSEFTGSNYPSYYAQWLAFQVAPALAPVWHRKFSAAPPPPSAPSLAHESYLSGSSSSYMDEMYEAWARDPKSVHPSWDAYFKGVHYQAPPSLGMTRSNEIPLSALGPAFAAQSAQAHGAAGSALQPSTKTIEAHLSVQASIRLESKIRILAVYILVWRHLWMLPKLLILITVINKRVKTSPDLKLKNNVSHTGEIWLPY